MNNADWYVSRFKLLATDYQRSAQHLRKCGPQRTDDVQRMREKVAEVSGSASPIVDTRGILSAIVLDAIACELAMKALLAMKDVRRVTEHNQYPPPARQATKH